ncbi:PQQ-dependent sugar dehydrogenase [uncultured Sphingomonas sp.]|uniref:PQQ-dependent sugar dehydrogenase n=1 Tax=uncultured Sphingomonas sp. TaxID=158754 RepID=UPI0035CB5736
MTWRSFLLLVAVVGSACSAPGDTGSAAAQGKSGVPRNSPLEPDIRNVPATTGRANVAPTTSPFAVATIGSFVEPFAMAFLPDGGLMVTEKAGHLKLRDTAGNVVEVAGIPAVAVGGQGGLLDIAVAPDFAASRTIYWTYAEPGNGGSALALAKAMLKLDHVVCVRAPCPARAHLENLQVIWRSGSNGPGGQFGAIVTFAPDGKSLFLTSGERQRFTPAQDPKQALGKILHLMLDGKAAPGNPMYAKGGVEAMTWSTGHRNPYGLVFTPDGRLWEEEMGPRGGDEVNLILPGRNYGWPIVSNGDNYSGQPIPDHPSRPDLEAPKLWWNPVISPGGMIYYSGAMFPDLKGSLLIAALSGEALVQVKPAGDAATAGAVWPMGTRIRDVAQAPDGAIWLLEDDERGAGGKLLRLTPKK